MKFEWEVIDSYTDRAKVPGGWLVRHHAGMGAFSDWRVAMAFVPDPKHDWVIGDEEEPVMYVCAGLPNDEICDTCEHREPHRLNSCVERCDDKASICLSCKPVGVKGDSNGV